MTKTCYMKIVEWSDADRCYVGRCPELMLGGVHGRNEEKVFAALCAAIDDWVSHARASGNPLPKGTAGRNHSGKVNLRPGH